MEQNLIFERIYDRKFCFANLKKQAVYPSAFSFNKMLKGSLSFVIIDKKKIYGG